MNRPPVPDPPSDTPANHPSNVPSNHPANSNLRQRPLRPAPPQQQPDGSGGTSSSSLMTSAVILPPKRISSSSACELCRHKKTKCDNRRPSCGRCVSLAVPCSYDADVNETSNQALKRKYAAADRELSDLRELFRFLRHRTFDEASTIFSRIRIADDPIEVLQSVKDAELFLPLRSPYNSPGRSSSASFVGSSAPSALGEHLDRYPPPFRVPAKPWTSLVTDAAVSELVFRFFSNDNPYLLLAIDQDAFLRDMRDANPTRAEHCSPFLVSAICAVSCLDGYGGRALLHSFEKESKRLLDLEQGRALLPTSVGLYLLYLVSAFLGRDRAGLYLRQMSIETLRRLRLENKYARLGDGVADHEMRKKHISRALWGLFIVETRFSTLYGQLPLTPPPGTPQGFVDSSDTNVATPASHPIASIPKQLQPTPDIVHAACDVAKLQHDVQVHITRSRSGSDEDVEKEMLLLSQLQSSWLSMSAMGEEIGASRQSCYLRFHLTEVFLSLLRTLPSDLPVPHPSFPDSAEKTTIGHICEFVATSTLHAVDTFFEHEQPQSANFAVGIALYHCIISMIPSLPLVSSNAGESSPGAPGAVDVFSSCCSRLRICAQTLPVFGHLLQAIAALAWKYDRQIPLQAQSCLQGLGSVQEGNTGIPIGFTVPHLRAIAQHVGTDDLEVELGDLISEMAAVHIKER